MPTRFVIAAFLPLALVALAGCAAVGDPAVSESSDVSERGVDESLGACASPLMRAIYERSVTVVDKGTVPSGLFASHVNRGRSEVLVEGPAIFSAMAELVAGAEADVALDTFVWEAESEAARAIVAAIGDLAMRRAAAGATEPVTVRLLVDASQFGVPSPKASDTMPVLAASIEALGLDPAFVTVEIAAYEHTTVGNQHAKALVVDGRSAIVTGANPQAHHDAGEPWHDTGYRVDGDVALGLLADFDDAWARSRLWTCGSAGGSSCLRDTPPIWHVTLASDVPEDACVPMLVVGRKRNANPINNRVDNTQDQAFLAAFESAEYLVRIETPNLNDDHAKEGLVSAVLRGVTVEVITSKGFNEGTESVPGQGGGNAKNVAALYEELDRLGIPDPCSHLDIRWYSFDGLEPVVGNGPRASHAKYATIDERVAIVGSTNMDTQSWNNAHEVNVVVDDEATVAAWDEQVFRADFARAVRADRCR